MYCATAHLPGLSPTVQLEEILPSAGIGAARNSTKLQRRENPTSSFGMAATSCHEWKF